MTSVGRGPRIFASLVESFISSDQFQNNAANTKELWGRELREAGDLDNLGIYSQKEIRPSLVQKYLDGLNGRPGKQAAAKAAIRALDKWCSQRDWLPRSITYGVQTGRPEGGHIPWTDAQVVTAERHVRPDFSRVITLAACTGQRVSDLVRMDWTDIEKYKSHEGINITQKKTGRTLWVPINAKLADAMATWGRRDVGPILLRAGARWKSSQLTDVWDYAKKHTDGLREHLQLGLVMHGLRGHRVVQLAREGKTDRQIGNMVGMSVGMVSNYTRFSSQKDNAIAAMRTSGERDS